MKKTNKFKTTALRLPEAISRRLALPRILGYGAALALLPSVSIFGDGQEMKVHIVF